LSYVEKEERDGCAGVARGKIGNGTREWMDDGAIRQMLSLIRRKKGERHLATGTGRRKGGD